MTWKETAESFSVSPAFIQELSAFRNPNDIIGLFSKYGTHFLSGYSVGDCIYQVFVYDEQVYNGVLQQFPQNPNNLFGYNGVLFRLFTKPRYTVPHSDLAFGHSEHVGKVLALSRDPHLETIRPHLKDSTYNVNESIFTFLTNFSIFEMT